MRRCQRNHVGGPGVRVWHGCVHAGPMGLALLLGVVMVATALSNPAIPWWGVVLAGLFWPLVSFVGQVIAP